MPVFARRIGLLVALAAGVGASLLLALSSAWGGAPPHRGVQVHPLWSSTSNSAMLTELNLANRAGSTVVRADIGWSSLEQEGRGRFSSWYVHKLDRFVNAAAARGIKVIAVVWGTPCWASTAPGSAKQGCSGAWWDRGVTQHPPSRAGDYGRIVGWIAGRYGDKLAAVEVWNEPGLNQQGRFWRSPDPAGDYAALLRAAYPAAKRGRPWLAVLAGSLSGPDRPWLGALYSKGIRGYYDGLAVHPYRDPGFNGLKSVRAMQIAHGDTKPVWVTEVGWPTSSGDGGGEWHVSESDQANEIVRGFGQLKALTWVRAIVLYELRDQGTDDSEMEDNWGVVRRDFDAKPGYEALRRALQ